MGNEMITRLINCGFSSQMPEISITGIIFAEILMDSNPFVRK